MRAKLLAFFAVAGKDLKLFFRRKTTAALMVLSPLVIVLFIGALLAGEGTGAARLKVGYCDFDGTDASKAYFSGFSNFSLLELHDNSPQYAFYEECFLETKRQVERGRYSLALGIPPGFTQGLQNGEGKTVEAWLDNSRTNLVGLQRYYLDAVTKRASYELSVAFVSVAWAKLYAADEKMRLLSERIPVAKGRITAIDAELSSFEARIEKLDSVLTQSYSQAILSEFNGTRASLDATLSLLDAQAAAISNSNSQLKQAQTVLKSANESQSLSSGLAYSLYSQNSCASSPSTQECALLSSLVKSSNDALSLTSAAAESLGAITRALDSLELQLGNTRGQLRNASASLEETRKDLIVSSAISGLGADLVKQRTLEQTKQLKADLKEISAQLDETDSNLNETRAELSRLAAQNPDRVISPLEIEVRDSFEPSKYTRADFLLYGIIAIVTMVTSLLISSISLIRERNSAAYSISRLSALGDFTLLLGKFAAAMAIMAMQAIVLLALFNFVLGARLSNIPLLAAAMLLISSSFVSLGFIIASFTKSENSAVLASIAITIPALFVSDLIVPIELANQNIQLLAKLFPGTLGISAMKYASLYSNSEAALQVLNTMAYAFLLLFLAAYIAIKRSKH